MPGQILRRACKDPAEAVPEEILEHPNIEVQAEGLGSIFPVEPDPCPVHIDRTVDPEQVQGVVEDHGIEGCLDTMTDAEVFAGLDIDDLQDCLPVTPLTEPD